MKTIITILEDFLAIESFNVDTATNGYSISVCGQKFDPDNDWDENPTEYHSVTLVTQSQDELLEAVAFIAQLPNEKTEGLA